MATLHVGDHLDASSIGSRHWLQLLAPHARVIRYEARGCGLSADDSAGPLSLETCAEDIEAVVNMASAGPVAVLALTHGALPAIVFAALHPECVDRIVLRGGYARGRMRRNARPEFDQESQAIVETMQVAYGTDLAYSALFRRVLLSRLFPQANDEQLNELDRASITRMTSSVAAQYTRLSFDADVSALARRIACPALVLHARDDPMVPFAEGRHLAALIPRARLLPLDGCLHLPLADDAEWPRLSNVILSFLGFSHDPAALEAAAGDAGAPAPWLTPRQREVLQRVAFGQTDKQIARALDLSPRTVEMHVAGAMKALGGKTRAEAVHAATEQGLLEP